MATALSGHAGFGHAHAEPWAWHPARNGLVVVFLVAGLARAAPTTRPDLENVQSLATAKLQTIAKQQAQPAMPANVVLYAAQPAAGDPTSNYQRTALGDWPVLASVDRNDPWLRLLLLAPKRPVIIDLAVFIDGKPFRQPREAWIDDALKEGEAMEAPALTTESGADASTPKDAATATASATADAAPTVDPQARVRPNIRSRVLNYIAASVEPVDREEIRWLLAEWGSGPTVVTLGPSLSWQRASVAPLLAALDRDHDGSLSAAEIAGADQLLRSADRDGDDVVDDAELRRASDHPPATPYPMGHSLVAAIDDNTDWPALAAELERVYGAAKRTAPQGRWFTLLDAANAKARLADGPADVTLRVEIAGKAEQSSAISVLGIGSELKTANPAAGQSGDVIALNVDADALEFSAAAAPDEIGATQIAIGAAIDGNPIERLIDADQDHRLTLRERQQLGGLLAALDRNGNGQVAADEIPIPIRFAVTLGPQVHALLASPTAAARGFTPREIQAAPDWFASMDKNGDRDLSRDEFLGTAEQFTQFDADADGLVSVAEAVKAKID